MKGRNEDYTSSDLTRFVDRSSSIRLRLSHILAVITGIVGLVLFGLTMLQVISRLFGKDIDWIWESLRVLIIWSLSTGVFAASLRDGHYRVNLGSSEPISVANPNLSEVFRQLLIVVCLGFLFIVSIPTIEKTKIHKLATLPFDERVFRIGFISAVGGMLLAHLWSLIEAFSHVRLQKSLKRNESEGGD